MAADRTRTLRGALAGAVAATVWAAQQPLDRRVFGVDFDDATLLGSFVTRDRRSRAALPIGLAMHAANGAVFGAVYARVAPTLPGPRPLRGVAAGLAEHLATWPVTRFSGLHPAGGQFPQLWGSRAAFAQATWRHLLFGAVLGAVEQRLNPDPVPPAPADPERAAGNGHGDPSHLVVVAPA
ncbi:MAG TPA: DUF6789 family protein [Solirubrobacteraceae bacterium]|nr:DUF6789 family protein [Solirubrobacteraceae bacterium]